MKPAVAAGHGVADGRDAEFEFWHDPEVRRLEAALATSMTPPWVPQLYSNVDFAAIRPSSGTDLVVLHSAAMTRYYFHIDGKRPHQDGVGEELNDDCDAWRTALGLATSNIR